MVTKATVVALLLLVGAGQASRAADLSVNLGNGFVLKPYGLYQLDEGGFSNSDPGGQSAGFNARRLRTGARLEYRDQFEAGLIWDFGHAPGGEQTLFEAQLTYSGLKPFAFTVGVFKPSFGLESMQGAGDTLFMERASISNITRNLAASISREAIQALAAGDRYHVAASLTAGQAGPGRDGDQRALVARAVGLPIKTDELTLHVDVSGEYVFRPARDVGKLPALSLSDQPELRIDDIPAPLSTGSIQTSSVGAVGPELGVAYGRFYAQGEWYQILLDRRQNAGGGTLGFTGWYAQAAYTVLGKPRQWKPASGAWGAPTPAEGFDPQAGNWGAVEIGARYSTADLNSDNVRGGRQHIWTAGVNWYPVEPLRFTLEYEHANIDGGRSPRSFDAVATRAQLQF